VATNNIIGNASLIYSAERREFVYDLKERLIDALMVVLYFVFAINLIVGAS
jgi:hypothetical protein